MTEQEFLASTDPAAMLARLQPRPKSTAPGAFWKGFPVTDRKLRLFACACCRAVWDQLTDDSPCQGCVKGWVSFNRGQSGMVCPDCSGTGRINRSRRVVEVAERFADGLASQVELSQALTAAGAAHGETLRNRVSEERRLAAHVAQWVAPINTAHYTPAQCAAEVLSWQPDRKEANADLLRHIVGNVFRPLKPLWGKVPNKVGVPIDVPTDEGWWLMSHAGDTVISLATTLYSGDQSASGPLMDALIEAGAPEEISGHFAEPCPYCKDAAFDTGDHGGPLASGIKMAKHLNSKCVCKGTRLKYATHMRGCFVLDLILGKE